jgi:hypothetical protein
MPIRAERKHLYPPEWSAISQRIRMRDGNRCKWCGVPNGRLGGRDRQGNWWDAHPLGEKMLSLEWPKPGEWAWCGRDGHQPKHLRIIRIVLTVAHLDHDETNCADDNLAALCQRCHLTYDAKHHAASAAETRRRQMKTADMFAPRSG